MTFRPRYSLLAFLLFTAAVAGGVKLWRGPHRVIIESSTVPTGSSLLPNQVAIWEDKAFFTIIEKMSLARTSQTIAAGIECEYIREWSENKVTTACETWNRPRFLVRVQSPDSSTKSFVIQSDEMLKPETAKLVLLNISGEIKSIEKLSCWVAGNSQQTRIEYKRSVVPLIGLLDYFDIQLLDDDEHAVYFLTTTGNIYQLATNQQKRQRSQVRQFDLNPITLPAIADPMLHSRVSERLPLLHE